MRKTLPSWKERTRQVKAEAHVLYLACKHPRTPWYAKLFAGGLVAYVFSPVDLIPDFIPVLGHLDELVIVPTAVVLIRKMIPAEVLAECRDRAQAVRRDGKRVSWVVGGLILGIWGVVVAFVLYLIIRG